MHTNQLRSFSSVFCRAAGTVAMIACASVYSAQAQQAADQATNPDQTASLFAANSDRPMDLAHLAGVSYSSASSSSSSSSDADAQPEGGSADPLHLYGSDPALQPPPRRRYGSPRYNDNMHNSDGSNKYVFEASGGLQLPIGDTYRYFNTGYSFSVGGGRQFNKKFAVLLKFDYDHFGINKVTLDNQTALYLGAPCTPQTAPNGGCGTDIDGNSHVWAFTLNPMYTFYQSEKYGAYVVGGVGYYHKVTNFTTPETEEIETFYGPEEYTANATFDHYSSNSVGVSGGFGLTYKFSRFAGERFFIEGRYVFMANSQREGYVYANNSNGYAPTGSNADPNDFFPANSNRTTYIPIRVGIRF